MCDVCNDHYRCIFLPHDGTTSPGTDPVTVLTVLVPLAVLTVTGVLEEGLDVEEGVDLEVAAGTNIGFLSVNSCVDIQCVSPVSIKPLI